MTAYVEGLQPLRVHPLGVVDLVAVVVLVVFVVVIVDNLRPAGAQILGAHARVRLHRVVAS